MSKPVILTGLRANNDLHIGNYLGALLPMVDLAKQKAGEYQVNLFVPDLHSFTTPIDHKALQDGIMQNLRVFVAAGLPLDHDDVFVYRQSYIPAHSELTWILDCFTSFGVLQRMTQFKDKSADLDNHVTAGLFNYPVLMAADILLYGAKYVPVGDDQTQHLEFTRDLARSVNVVAADKFPKGLFEIPAAVADQHKFFGKDQGLRVRDLQNPAKKMSKSEASGKGVIFLTDSPDEARQKVMSAETDSVGKINYDYKEQPGVSNLLDIYKLLGGNSEEFIGQTQYGPLKEAVAGKAEAFLKDFQAKLAKVDDQKILNKLEASELLMSKVANQRLFEVQKAVGLRS